MLAECDLAQDMVLSPLEIERLRTAQKRLVELRAQAVGQSVSTSKVGARVQ